MKKSKDYVTIPVDAFSVVASDNSVRVFFGLEDVPGDTESIEFSCGTYMTHKSLKTLSIILSGLVEKIETMSGQIVLDPAKVQKIKDSFEASVSNVPTASPPPA